MSNTPNTTVTTKNPFDIFIIGLRKGFNGRHQQPDAERPYGFRPGLHP